MGEQVIVSPIVVQNEGTFVKDYTVTPSMPLNIVRDFVLYGITAKL
jgi:hypothetical protein